ncbi:hypothetical protein KY330_05120 [Candidatus Woesearchaeota archaeon]|nr:hypothetical protein [Candidatus Woesearchaeota archaeon]
MITKKILEECLDDFWVLKWKGHRELDQDRDYKSYNFPNELVYRLSPFSFRNNIAKVTGEPGSVCLNIKDGHLQCRSYSDELVMPLYDLVKQYLDRPRDEELKELASPEEFPEIFYPGYLHDGTVTRKWGKEKVELFHNGNPEKAFLAYATLRREEQIYSSALFEPMPHIITEIENLMPGFIGYALTSGSHSRNWGGAAGNLMSWIDSDVDIDLIVDAERSQEYYEILKYLCRNMHGDHLHAWGQTKSHQLFIIDRKIPDIELPFTGQLINHPVKYYIFFTTIEQFFKKETDYMAFLMANGTLLAEKDSGTYNSFHKKGLQLYPFGDPKDYVDIRP